MGFAKAVSGPGLFFKRLRSGSKTSRSRTYIMPTGFGLAFGAMGFVLLLMAIGYANNLIYLYVFSVVSVAITSMYLTNKNIDQVLLEDISAPDFFALESGQVSVEIFAPKPAQVLEFQLGEGPWIPWTGNASEKRSMVYLSTTFPKRGLQKMPKLRMRSLFPFGIFRAWKQFVKPEAVLVFPARRGRSEFPTELENQLFEGQGLFRDHRLYQSTDSPRRIDWRASVRAQDLLVKNFESIEPPIFYFNLDQVIFLEDPEARLEQLCLWLSRAEEQGLRYALDLKSQSIPPASGPSHLRKCLESLALLKVEP